MYGSRTLVFKLKNDGNTISFSQSAFSSILFLILILGFLSASIILRNPSWIIGAGIIVTLDLLLEWVVAVFMKKDAVRNGQQIVETGSIWGMDKSIKVILTKPAENIQ